MSTSENDPVTPEAGDEDAAFGTYMRRYFPQVATPDGAEPPNDLLGHRGSPEDDALVAAYVQLHFPSAQD